MKKIFTPDLRNRCLLVFIQNFLMSIYSLSLFWLYLSHDWCHRSFLLTIENILNHIKWQFEIFFERYFCLWIMKNQQKMFSMQKSFSYKEEKFKTSIKRSQTTSAIESNRGFKPTDRFDPSKKSFLVDLSKKIWNKSVWLITLTFQCFFLILWIFRFYFYYYEIFSIYSNTYTHTHISCKYIHIHLGWKNWGKETDRFTKDFHTS